MYTVTLPYPPSVNEVYRFAGKRMYMTEAGTQYKKDVWILCREAKIRTAFVGPVSVSISVYRQKVGKRGGDLDNRLKVLLDSLQTLAFVDDSQVSEIHAYRHEDPKNPRVVVIVSEIHNSEEVKL